jgi:hypothetical protein
MLNNILRRALRLANADDYNTNGGGVLVQLVMDFTDGTRETVVTGGPGWVAMAADSYYNPTPPSTTVFGIPGQGTAYRKVMENTNASAEIVGWRTSPTVDPAVWPAAVPSSYQARDALVARMGRPLQVYDPPVPTVVRNSNSPSFLVDFGRNFQGGFVISATAKAGTTLRIIGGELLLPNGTTDASTGSRIAPSNTWGYEFNWTLRDGAQVVSQHNYMLFRCGLKPTHNYSPI